MPRIKPKVLRVLPYIAVGGLIFYFNSTANFNYLVKGYLALLECQAFILLSLWLAGKLKKEENS